MSETLSRPVNLKLITGQGGQDSVDQSHEQSIPDDVINIPGEQRPNEQDQPRDDEAYEKDQAALVRVVEALLFLSPQALSTADIAGATEVTEEDVADAIQRLTKSRSDCGVVVRELAGGFTLATIPEAEEAARTLLGKPRTPPLSAAQAETLAIVAYSQPISRPEIARIRGVASESATQALVERGLIEEAGRSQFGAVLFNVTTLFLKVFGIKTIDDLPDPSQWDPSPAEEESLRERLLKAGDQRLNPS